MAEGPQPVATAAAALQYELHLHEFTFLLFLPSCYAQNMIIKISDNSKIYAVECLSGSMFTCTYLPVGAFVYFSHSHFEKIKNF